jgi:hypothetical protein
LIGELGDVADALERALAAANSTPRRGGRPRGAVNANHEKLQAFLMDFYQGIVIGCSGRLSFDPKNGGSGKLIRALELIEPCLPPGFLPPRLPLKPIHRWIRALKSTPPKTSKK